MILRFKWIYISSSFILVNTNSDESKILGSCSTEYYKNIKQPICVYNEPGTMNIKWQMLYVTPQIIGKDTLNTQIKRERGARTREFWLPIESIIVNVLFPIFSTVQIVFGRFQSLIYRIRQLYLLQQIESDFHCKCFDALQQMNTTRKTDEIVMPTNPRIDP